MELNGRVLVRERTIHLYDGELTLTYDPLAVKESEMRELQWVEFVARAVKSWDLTIGGQPVPLAGDGLRAACDVQVVSAVVAEIGMAVYRDLTTFPKATLSAPRVLNSTPRVPTTEPTTSLAAS